MAVTRRLFVGAGAVTAASWLLGLERAVAARKRKRVFARAGVAQGVGTVGLTVARTRYVETGSQAAVALTPLDGEIISGSTQSNFQSNGFYGRNGHTRSADWTGTNPLGADYAGWDDPNFIPICIWLCDFAGTSFYARMDDLGINGMLPMAGSVSLANNITFEKWAYVVPGDHPGGTISAGNDPGVLGVSTGEEPGDAAAVDAIMAEAATWLASSDGPGRMHLFNHTDPLLNGGVETYDATELMDMGDWITCDQYWFAGNSGGTTAFKLAFRLYGTYPTEPSLDQGARGSHYGSMIDCLRDQFLTDIRPTGIWIENGAPYTSPSDDEITPAQMKWAIWATIVHGGRSIHYFNHTFREGDPGIGANNFNNNYYGGPGVAGTGMYAAAKEVNLRALELASVIKSPFDGYFVFGDSAGQVTNPGFLTAVTSTNARAAYAGVDACCKWQPVEAKHYILATTRESGSATNIPVTYRMVDQGQATATDLWTDTPISVTRGGAIPGGFCEFADTFATGASYKAYRID